MISFATWAFIVEEILWIMKWQVYEWYPFLIASPPPLPSFRSAHISASNIVRFEGCSLRALWRRQQGDFIQLLWLHRRRCPFINWSPYMTAMQTGVHIPSLTSALHLYHSYKVLQLDSDALTCIYPWTADMHRQKEPTILQINMNRKAAAVQSCHTITYAIVFLCHQPGTFLTQRASN